MKKFLLVGLLSLNAFAQEACLDLESSFKTVPMDKRISKNLEGPDLSLYKKEFPRDNLVLENEAVEVCFKKGRMNIYMTFKDASRNKLVSFDGVISSMPQGRERVVDYVIQGHFGIVYWKNEKAFDTTTMFSHGKYMIINPSFSRVRFSRVRNGSYRFEILNRQ